MTVHFHPSDLTIYAAHACFWLIFIGARVAARQKSESSNGTPTSKEKKTAEYSRLLVTLHFIAFGLMYSGIALAVFCGTLPNWFPAQRIVGALVIAAGATLAAAAVWYFRSWRFRAELTAGHQLATGGPFSIWRHPIYTALTLLALGTALWIPTPIVWAAFILMAVGSDLRARAEEKLLIEAFGSAYTTYRTKTCRFIPGLY